MKKILLFILFLSYSIIGFSQANKKVFGKLTVVDTIITDKGYKFPDGSFQSTAGGGTVNVADSLKAGVTDSLLINTNALVVKTTGQVGIGIAIPTEKLEVVGSIFSSAAANISPGTTGQGQIRILGSGYSASIALDATAMFIGHTSPSRGFIIRTNNIERFKIDNNANIVFNETGVDVNFRIRSNANVNAFFLDGLSGNIGIRTATPNASLDVRGLPGTIIGGFASGSMHVTSTSTAINANSVITGHSLSGGNKQLWYFGSVSSNNDDIAFINRQVGSIAFLTSNATRVTIEAAGNVIFEQQIQIKGGVPDAGKVLTSDAVGFARWETPSVVGVTEANFFSTTDNTTQTVAVANTFQTITFATNDELDGWTHTAGTDAFTCNQTGKYRGSVTMQLQKTGGVSSLVEFRLTINGVPAGAGHTFVQDLITNNEIKLLTATNIVSLTSGDVVRFEFTSNTTTTEIVLPVTTGANPISIVAAFNRIQ